MLVVEDEAAVRKLAARILQNGGYEVITTGSPEEALEMCAAGEAHIDLVLSDMIMPGMSGPQLSSGIKNVRSDLAMLFMSGYPGDVIAQGRDLDPELQIVMKPFTEDQLLAAVREKLNSRVSPG